MKNQCENIFMCSVWFNIHTNSNLKTDMKFNIRSQIDDQYSWQICRQVFAQNSESKINMVKRDIQEICFPNNSTLEKHMREHINEKPQSCRMWFRIHTEFNSISTH